jgi:hypothetical protein
MYDLSLIEAYYDKFTKDLDLWNPEGFYSLNLTLLHHFDLLHFQPLSLQPQEANITRYFHMIESPEKITLVNNDFIVWIIPERREQMPLTSILIALNDEVHDPRLEVVFVASGVYNTSKLVLKVLEKFLMEIQETENVLTHLR